MTVASANQFAQPTPIPSARRGECPTLQKPMQTGDGLLARLRPLDSHLTLVQLRALAQAAARFGNGIVEITARGSLQVRGLKPETVAPFEGEVLETGIRIPAGVGIETPPLAGLDPEELVDVRPIAEELRQRIAAHVPPLVLAPKLAITLDGGGLFHLGHVAADVKLTAFRDGDMIKFLLALGSPGMAPRSITVVERSRVIDAIIGVLEKLAAKGPAARGKDLDLPGIDGPKPTFAAPPLVGIQPPPFGLPAMSERQASGRSAILGLALRYCQADAADLVAFADAAEALGASAVRLAPDHGLFVTGLTLGQAQQLRHDAAALGFITEPGDPCRSVSLCAGSRGCASAFYDTRALAAKVLSLAPDLLDGSFDIHLSGCAKGCAHPAAAPITLVGARAGYGLVVNGAASAAAATYIAENDIDIALQRLQALVRQSKEEDESVRACLLRLGADAIADALQLDGT